MAMNKNMKSGTIARHKLRNIVAGSLFNILKTGSASIRYSWRRYKMSRHTSGTRRNNELGRNAINVNGKRYAVNTRNRTETQE